MKEDERNATAEPVSGSHPPLPPRGAMHHSILLVEDDNVTLKAVEAMLRIHGNYRVTTAMNVEDALHRIQEARASGRAFDLVLTDLCLPEVSGLSILHQIADTPVVVMSCQDSQASVLQAFEAGAADYLIKPIRKNEVSTLWQHIWRSNRFKAVVPGSGAAPAPAALPCNDSGASTSTGIMDQATPQGSGSLLQAGAETSCLDSAPQRHEYREQQLAPAAQHRASPRASLHIPTDLKAEPVPGAAVAAVHIDLPISHPAPAAHSPRPNTEAHAADTLTPADCDEASPSGVEDQGSTEAWGGGAPCAGAQLHGAASSKAPLQLPPSRPLATSTAGSSSGGHPRPLPLGLQELAALGQQREHGGAQQVPSLWQPPCQQRNARAQAAAQRQPSPALDDAGPEQSSPGLNHSGGSAFTAVTVFLPRPRAAEAEPTARSSDLDALLAAPRPQEAVRAAAAPAGPQHPLPAALLPAACQGNPWASVVLPALPPLSACGSAGAQAHAMQAAAQLTLNPVYLPQSVIQLICALSGSAAGCGMVGPAATQAAVCSGPTRTSSGQVSDASHFSKAAHRQAAVAKYLEKRKIRSFQKKVRYESRKRLAESRPRVKGQFVKQGGGNADAAAAAAAAGGPPALAPRKREDEAAAVLAGMAQPAGKRSKAAAAAEADSVDSDDDIMSECQP